MNELEQAIKHLSNIAEKEQKYVIIITCEPVTQMSDLITTIPIPRVVRDVLQDMITSIDSGDKFKADPNIRSN